MHDFRSTGLFIFKRILLVLEIVHPLKYHHSTQFFTLIQNIYVLNVQHQSWKNYLTVFLEKVNSMRKSSILAFQLLKSFSMLKSNRIEIKSIYS